MFLGLLACRSEYDVADPCGLGANPLAIGEADLVGAGATREDDVLDDIVTLTPAEPSRAGSAFHLGHRLSADDLDVRFEFRVGGGTGADGFAFVVVDPDLPPSDRYLGWAGGCLGFGSTPVGADPACQCGGGLPGWAVTFDTWWNDCFDPIDLVGDELTPHGALVLDGALTDSLATWPLAPLERDRWHTAELVMRGGALAVTIDGRVAWEGVAEVPAFFGHVGFTAATGLETDRHEVRALSVRPGACLLEDS